MMDVKGFYEQHASEHAEKNKLESLPSGYEDMLNRFIESMPENSRVLDAGSGNGRDAAYFEKNGLDAVAVDLSTSMVQKYDGDGMLMDVSSIGFDSSCFGGYWSPATIHFLPPERARLAVEEAERVLIGGGIAHFGFKLGENQFYEMDRWGDTVTYYGFSEEKARSLVLENEFSSFWSQTVSLEDREFLNLFVRR